MLQRECDKIILWRKTVENFQAEYFFEVREKQKKKVASNPIMKFKHDDPDAFNCTRTKAKQQTETFTDTCPSSGQYQYFPLLLLSLFSYGKGVKKQKVLLSDFEWEIEESYKNSKKRKKRTENLLQQLFRLIF